MDAIRLDNYENDKYTIDDIYALPDGKRAELIDGKMYMMAIPNRLHQKLVYFLDRTIGNYIYNKNGDKNIPIS